MKHRSAYLGILAMTLVMGPYALADEATSTFVSGMEEHNKGMLEVVESPVKEIEDTAAGMDDADPVTGTVDGAMTGADQTSDEALEGTDEIVEGTEEMIDAPVKALTE